MEQLEDRGVGQQRLDVGRAGRARRDLHHVGGAVAGRKLHDAQPVAADIETHGLGVDRDRADLVAGEVRQIAAVQADGHCGSRNGRACLTAARRVRQLPRWLRVRQARCHRATSARVASCHGPIDRSSTGRSLAAFRSATSTAVRWRSRSPPASRRSRGATLLYPVLPVLAADLKVDEAQIGLVMAAFTAPAIVLAPLFGILADLYGRRWLLVFGLARVRPRRRRGGVGADLRVGADPARHPGHRRERAAAAHHRADQRHPAGRAGDPADRASRSRSIASAMIVLPLLGGALAILSWRAAFVPFLLIVLLALAALSVDAGDRPAGTGLAPAISRAHLARDPRAAPDAGVRDRLPALLPRLRPLHLSADHRRAALRRDAGGRSAS